MQSKFTTSSMLFGIAASFVLAGTFALTPADARAATYAPITLSSGNWKIDVAKSKFGPERNTMVIERADASSSAGANGTSNTFVVIANGKVYIATSSEAYDTISSNGAKKIDYSRWKDMRLVQVGENAQSINGGMPEMGNVVVFNRR